MPLRHEERQVHRAPATRLMINNSPIKRKALVVFSFDLKPIVCTVGKEPQGSILPFLLVATFESDSYRVEG
jgi:hypothetical protein